jgi:hypothetical protein
VVARSKAYICGRSLAGIAGSNPAGDMNVCSCECGVFGCNREASITSRPCPSRNRFILTFIPFFVSVPPSQYFISNLK